jgi:IMP dehydrogenase/GMP reductase
MTTIKFDFDDILIVPKVHGDISSRYKDIILPSKLPLFTAPMDTVVNYENKNIFLENKINVVLPRTVPYLQFLAKEVMAGKLDDGGVFVSFGLNNIRTHITGVQRFHKNANILIDVANGHMKLIVDICKEIKKFRPDVTIMVGNIANPETYRWYAENNCVDYIRVGIGNGNGCITSKQSGVGYPLASLIQEVFHEKLLYVYDHKDDNDFKFAPAIVADGGMKDYADIIKAFALGADYVMIGSIFNKALESCADNYVHGIKIGKELANRLFDKGYPIKKYFRGMSTKEAQKAMGKTRLKTSEGVTRYRKVEYHLNGWVENFEHYLRNAMSYSDARTLNDFIGKADICQITDKAYVRLNK